MAEKPEVPVKTKVLYGLGELGVNLKNETVNRYLLFFYADTLRVSPTAVGLMMLLGKAWDAITDPAMGYVSDTTRSRWGRRRPYVLAGAIPMGVCFYLLFAPPFGLESGGLLVYLLLMSLALYTFFTVFTVPYLAWGAELARGYHERTAVVQIRSLCGLVGGIVGASLPLVLVGMYPGDARGGFASMALILGVAVAAAALVPGLTVRDAGRDKLPVASFTHFLSGLTNTFANRDFRVIFITFCLMTVSAAMGTAIQLVVVKYRLNMEAEFPLLALTFGLAFAASFPLWFGLSQKIGKPRAMLFGLSLGVVAPLGWVIVQPGQVGAMLVFMIVAGVVTGSLTLAASQAIDVVDLDELLTGEQRAGAYFGIWAFGLKLATAIGQFLGGLLLDFVGYAPGAPQDANTLWWLVMLVGPLQSVVTLAGLLVFRRFRFEAADVAAVQAALAARRAEA
ncbi:MAG: MFS transporter [Deltaproteobacteria bacterium]|nr:MFS transporter [Deltaproteobacteria bacterium]